MSPLFPTMINVQAGKHAVTLIGKMDAMKGKGIETLAQAGPPIAPISRQDAIRDQGVAIVYNQMFPPAPPQGVQYVRAPRDHRR